VGGRIAAMLDLADWLASLPAEELAGILATRPDVVAPAEPRSVRELADRLGNRFSIGSALLSLPRPALQVAEAIQALGDGCSGVELAAAMGLPAEDAALADALALLRGAGLVWPDANRLRTVEMGHVWPVPLNLGAPAAALLAGRTAEELRRVAAQLGVTVGRLKREVVEGLAAWLTDGENVRAVVRTAPAATRELLEDATWHGPHVHALGLYYGYGDGDRGPAQWAVDRGLLARGGWGAPLEMACEVALALRGAEYHLPFDPVPPDLRLVDVPAGDVEGEAAAAGAAAVAHVAALLEVSAGQPVALLKSGGVGTRELRRLAKVIGDTVDHTRFWLELACSANLAAVTDVGVAPTAAYDDWHASQPAERLVALLDGWRHLGCAPLYQAPDGESPAPALRWPADGVLAAELRMALMRAAVSVPPGKGVPGAAEVVPLAAWHQPLAADQLEDAMSLGVALWREAELVGAVARGASSDLARALLRDDRDALTTVADRLLPGAHSTARFQADLTAVVPGTPSAELTELLDGAAARESRGTASTWRFSASSVRRALDAGQTAEGLVAALHTAASGPLPQPLKYLISDVARRHGAVRVREVACCVRSDDPSLLAEVLRSRALAPLGLSSLAPTVIGSAKPVTDTLRALRAAGYAPVAETADAAPVIERATRHRAVPVDRRPVHMASRRSPEPPRDPVAMAAAILAAGPAATDDNSGTAGQLRPAAPHLTLGELRLLAHAIDEDVPVHIDYINAQGNPSSRVIEEVSLDGHMLYAWCTLREDERVFALSRISSVAPA